MNFTPLVPSINYKAMARWTDDTGVSALRAVEKSKTSVTIDQVLET